MRLKTLLPCFASILLLASCSKDKSSKSASKENKSEESPLASSEAAPLDSSKANALWALAPDKAILGAVAMPGAGARMHATFNNVIAAMEQRPFGKKLVDDLRVKAQEEEFNPFDAEVFAKMGLDPKLGAAVFMVQKKQGYLVLPVVDRAAFREVTKGSAETVDGIEIDQHDDDLFCTQKDLYVCASSVEDLKGFGNKVDGSLAKRVAALPAEYRGDAEFVIDLAELGAQDPTLFDEEFFQFFGPPELGVLAFRYGNGSFTTRGWFQAKPKGMLEGADSVSNSLVKAASKQNPGALFALRVPPAVWEEGLAAKEDKTLPGGLSLKKDIVGNLTGEFLGTAASTKETSGTLSIGVKNGEPFKELLTIGCGMAGMALGEGVKVTPGEGSCKALVDFSKLPLPDPSIAKIFPEPLPVAVEIKSDQILISIGKFGPAIEAPRMSALGSDLFNNKWNFSVWAEGISIASSGAIPWKDLAALPADTLDGIKFGVWIMAHVYEFGQAYAIREDGVHGVVHIGTYAGDPPEAFQAYQSAVQTSLDGGDASAAFAAIHEKWPKTMAGQQGRTGGSVLIAGVTGALAAIAIPAFVKYQDRSREAMEAMDSAEQDMQEAQAEADQAIKEAQRAVEEAQRAAEEAAKN